MNKREPLNRHNLNGTYLPRRPFEQQSMHTETATPKPKTPFAGARQTKSKKSKPFGHKESKSGSTQQEIS